MKQVKMLSAAVLLALAGTANAGVTSTVTAASDYDYRGNSQTATDPALQASVDYAHESGWYVGAWGSNVDFGTLFAADGDPDFEIDIYTGYAMTFENNVGIDVGVTYYTYHSDPDPGINFFEVYAGISYDWFKAKLFYSPAFGGDASEAYALSVSGTDEVSALYLSTDATIPLPNNFSALAHVGFGTGDYFDNNYGDDQIDIAVGVGYTAGNFNLALKYITTESDVEYETDVLNNEDRVVFTVSTTFPWK